MTGWSAEGASRWLAEAVSTGSPLSGLPEDLAPPDVAAGEEVALALLAELGITPCGLRLLRRADGGVLAGPMIEGRLVPAGAPVALGALHHPLVTAAVIGVLADGLDAAGNAPPVLARLHPALDISSTRFSVPPEDAPTLTADLARLGLVVVGKGKAVPPGPSRVTLLPPGARGQGAEADLAAAFAMAAKEARRWGGLPAGALLVVAGLTPPARAEGGLRASLRGIGAVQASFV